MKLIKIPVNQHGKEDSDFMYINKEYIVSIEHAVALSWNGVNYNRCIVRYGENTDLSVYVFLSMSELVKLVND